MVIKILKLHRFNPYLSDCMDIIVKIHLSWMLKLKIHVKTVSKGKNDCMEF